MRLQATIWGTVVAMATVISGGSDARPARPQRAVAATPAYVRLAANARVPMATQDNPIVVAGVAGSNDIFAVLFTTDSACRPETQVRWAVDSIYSGTPASRTYVEIACEGAFVGYFGAGSVDEFIGYLKAGQVEDYVNHGTMHAFTERRPRYRFDSEAETAGFLQTVSDRVYDPAAGRNAPTARDILRVSDGLNVRYFNYRQGVPGELINAGALGEVNRVYRTVDRLSCKALGKMTYRCGYVLNAEVRASNEQSLGALAGQWAQAVNGNQKSATPYSFDFVYANGAWQSPGLETHVASVAAEQRRANAANASADGTDDTARAQKNRDCLAKALQDSAMAFCPY